MTTTREESIAAPDGGTFAGHLAVPNGGNGPGLVLLDRKAAQGCGMSAVERAACRPLRSLPRAILALTLIYRLTVTPM